MAHMLPLPPITLIADSANQSWHSCHEFGSNLIIFYNQILYTVMRIDQSSHLK